MNKNLFAAFDDEPAAAADASKVQKKDKPATKVVQKPVYGAPVKEERKRAPRPEGDGEERPHRGGRGERRGGRGGDRGGRGRGEFRGGRGGGRGQRREGEGGEVVEYQKKGGDAAERPRTSKQFRHEGKPEKHEGHDRKSGTGRGRRDERKDGHGKGNWGKKNATADEENAEGEKPAATEGEEETKKEKAPEEPKPETEYDIQKRKIAEEEAKVKTLDDYLNTRKTTNVKAQMREADKINIKNIEAAEGKADLRKTTIDGKLTGAMTYAPGGKVGEEAELLAFSAGVDDDYEGDRRGGRGGRGGRGRGDRPDRHEGGRKGGKGGKLKMNEDDFPAL